MRRAVVSIPSNIAEGSMRNSRKEFLQFLRIAYGSGAELETQLEIMKRLEIIKDFDYAKADQLLSETMKMLHGMISSINRN